MPHIPSDANLRSTSSPSDRINPYELAWSCALDGKVIISIPSARILDCNAAAEALTKFTKAELLGKTVYDLVPSEERVRVTEEIQRLDLGPARVEGFHAVNAEGHLIPIVVSTSGVIDVGDDSLISICEFQDVSKLKEQEYRLATKRWALSAYASAAIALSKHNSRSSLLTTICEAIATEPTYVFVWIAIAEHDAAKSIRVAAQAGPAIGILEGIQLSWSGDDRASRGPTPLAIRTSKLQTVDDTRETMVQSPWLGRMGQYGIRSCAAIPFRTPEALSGAIVVCANKPRAFDPVALEVFTHLAEQLGCGLHAIDQQEKLQAERDHATRADRQLYEALTLMMQPISLAMELRDQYTAGHQDRVGEISVAIAAEMGWSTDKLKGLRLAAQVHDIGKMSVPAEILTKPGRLSHNERALLNDHCEKGHSILKGIQFAWPIATIALQHHEKLDGSGYPNGLTADQILPESKIMTVADMFEAMTAHRPYRPAIPIDTVLDLLQADAGTKLDAEAVHICASLYRKGRFQHLFPK